MSLMESNQPDIITDININVDNRIASRRTRPEGLWGVIETVTATSALAMPSSLAAPTDWAIAVKTKVSRDIVNTCVDEKGQVVEVGVRPADNPSAVVSQPRHQSTQRAVGGASPDVYRRRPLGVTAAVRNVEEL
jgi:hypothetical protein